jgi:hypothetical protein
MDAQAGFYGVEKQRTSNIQCWCGVRIGCWALDVRCWMFHLVIAHAPDASSYKPNAFPPSDEGKAEVRVNQKSIMAIGITPLLFDSYHE